MLVLYASKVMLKILQARLQQYMNWELPDVQTGFRKGRGTRNQIANIYWVIEKAREFQKKKSTSTSSTMLKSLIVWITTNWKILKEMGVQDTFICLLRNLYAGQVAIVRIGHGTMGWFQKFNLYSENITWNAGLEDAQAGIKIARRIVNNLRYTDLPPLWQKVKKN